MDLILVAIATLVLLTVADAHLWPDASPQRRRQRHLWMSKRGILRRHKMFAPRSAVPLRFSPSRRRMSEGPLWWWE